MSVSLGFLIALSSALHHGNPGSFKTFTLIQRRAFEALKAGRVVVTNVRGFNDFEAVQRAFPEIEFPNTAEIIYVDTEIAHNRKMMALWYLWVPFGAVILIDEVQRIYRRKDKVEDLTAENFPEIYRDETIDGQKRPDNFFDAFDMQRHFNWDIFMSSTNIAKVRSEIREVCEFAYRHRSLSGLLPWKKNHWYEHMHDPEQSGKIASHRIGDPVEYTADPRIFECYKSTATGKHEQSMAGRSILSDPKLIFTLGGAIVLGSISLFLGLGMQSEKQAAKSAPVAVQSSAKAGVESNPTSGVKVAADVGHHGDVVIPAAKAVVTAPLADLTIKIDGHIIFVGTQRYYLKIISSDGSFYNDNTDSLIKMGYSVFRVSNCMFIYVYKGIQKTATC